MDPHQFPASDWPEHRAQQQRGFAQDSPDPPSSGPSAQIEDFSQRPQMQPRLPQQHLPSLEDAIFSKSTDLFLQLHPGHPPHNLSQHCQPPERYSRVAQIPSLVVPGKNETRTVFPPSGLPPHTSTFPEKYFQIPTAAVPDNNKPRPLYHMADQSKHISNSSWKSSVAESFPSRTETFQTPPLTFSNVCQQHSQTIRPETRTFSQQIQRQAQGSAQGSQTGPQQLDVIPEPRQYRPNFVRETASSNIISQSLSFHPTNTRSLCADKTRSLENSLKRPAEQELENKRDGFPYAERGHSQRLRDCTVSGRLLPKCDYAEGTNGSLPHHVPFDGTSEERRRPGEACVVSSRYEETKGNLIANLLLDRRQTGPTQISQIWPSHPLSTPELSLSRDRVWPSHSISTPGLVSNTNKGFLTTSTVELSKSALKPRSITQSSSGSAGGPPPAQMETKDHPFFQTTTSQFTPQASHTPALPSRALEDETTQFPPEANKRHLPPPRSTPPMILSRALDVGILQRLQEADGRQISSQPSTLLAAPVVPSMTASLRHEQPNKNSSEVIEPNKKVKQVKTNTVLQRQALESEPRTKIQLANETRQHGECVKGLNASLKDREPEVTKKSDERPARTAGDCETTNSSLNPALSSFSSHRTVVTADNDSVNARSTDFHGNDNARMFGFGDRPIESPTKGEGNLKMAKTPPTKELTASAQGRETHTRGYAIRKKRNALTEGSMVVDEDSSDDDEILGDTRASSRRIKEFVSSKAQRKQSSREDLSFLEGYEAGSEDDCQISTVSGEVKEMSVRDNNAAPVAKND